MSRMNSRTRKKLYPQVVARDGEHCKKCGAKSSEKSLVLDHVNNDNRDNRLVNLQIYCRSCNYKKNPRKEPPVDMCDCDCDTRPMTPEMTENRRMEPLFRNWLFEKVTTRGQIRWEDAINNGAERVRASTETIRRYLKKMTSSEEGLYTLTRDSQGYPCIQFKNSV